MGNIGVKGMEMENIGATELGTRNEKEREWKEWKQKGETVVDGRRNKRF